MCESVTVCVSRCAGFHMRPTLTVSNDVADLLPDVVSQVPVVAPQFLAGFYVCRCEVHASVDHTSYGGFPT
jgi:hypothetical protein